MVILLDNLENSMSHQDFRYIKFERVKGAICNMKGGRVTGSDSFLRVMEERKQIGFVVANLVV